MDWPTDLAEVAFRYNLISPLLDPAVPKAEKKRHRRRLVTVEHSHPTRGSVKISARTIRRWVRAYRLRHVQGLHKQPRRDRGPHVLQPAHLEFATTLLRENPRRETGFLLEELVARFPELEGRVGRSTLNRHLHAQGVPRRAVSEERADGPPYHRFEASAPNELWHSDCHHGPPAIGPDGNVVPTRIFAWIDDFSRVCCHCEAYAHESLPSLEDCFQKAMQKYGIPSRAYTDLGSLYSGVQFALICADLGIHHVPARPYSPWTHGKIERLWGLQEDQLWSEIALLPPVPLAQVNKWLQAWVDAEYHTRRHGTTGEAPLDRWHNHRPIVTYPTEDQIQRLFWLWERRKVSSTGVVQLCRNSYFVDPALARRTVLVRYNPYDLTQIQIWTTDRVPTKLCVATASPLLVRRRLNPPPPSDTTRLSPAAQRRIARLEKRYEEHRSRQMQLIRYPNQSDKGGN